MNLTANDIRQNRLTSRQKQYDQSHVVVSHGVTFGFTLVELLLAITIVGMLAAMTVTVVRQVYQSTRISQTELTISKIDQVVTEIYEEFETRRLPTASVPQHQQLAHAVRLWMMRDLMRMEMPTCWAEIQNGPAGMQFLYNKDGTLTTVPTAPSYIRVSDSPLRKLYARVIDGATVDPNDPLQSAKCLYLIITFTKPEARATFHDREIATDKDGLRYFVDGWGNPVNFLRWAPGLAISDRQPNILRGKKYENNWSDPDTNLLKAEASGMYVPVNVPQTCQLSEDSLNPMMTPGCVDLALSNPGNNTWLIDLTATWPCQDGSSTVDVPMCSWLLVPLIYSSGGRGAMPEDFGLVEGATVSAQRCVAIDPIYWPMGAQIQAHRNHAIITNHQLRR